MPTNISITETFIFALLTGSIMNILISIKDIIDTGLTLGTIVVEIVSFVVIIISVIWIIRGQRRGELKLIPAM